MEARGQQKGAAVKESNRAGDGAATCCAPDTLGRERDTDGERVSLKSTLFDHTESDKRLREGQRNFQTLRGRNEGTAHIAGRCKYGTRTSWIGGAT